ncbi:MAG: hypothetical protein JW995_02135 [Melioribacteraceae bacterium]|nr:hypothetical protein [Melioribacteraceae bacterium]
MVQRNLSSVLLIIILVSCSTEKPQIKLSSPEAFAYALDNGWELNATVVASGFEQKDSNELYAASISYTIDMITPVDTIKHLDAGELNEQFEEELMDLMIESQIEINSAFPTGEYKLVFYALDNYSQTKDTAEVKFNLSE